MAALHRDDDTSSISERSKKTRRGRALRVFDFDDTLVQNDSQVLVARPDGSLTRLSSGEYATYQLQPGERYDYSEFTKLVNPRVIKWTAKILDRVYRRYGPGGVVILTARGSGQIGPVHEFLVDAGLPDIHVVGLGSTKPSDKADWIAQRVSRGDLSYVEFFDDSPKNVAAVRQLAGKYPDVEIVVRQIVH